MIEAHDFINPTFNYLPRFNKPVLSYWIVAGLYKVFGVSVAVQRFGIALGALIVIACAFMLARVSAPASAMPQSGEGGPSQLAALWAAAGLAAAPRLVMFARRIFIDIWITAFMALTLTFFALSERYPERRRLFLVLMYVSVGLGALTKGPVAIALPALAFALYLVAIRDVRRILNMMLPLGIVIVAVIVVPWYYALYREHGWTYISSFLINENVERFTQGVGVRQPRPIWFYLPVVLSDSFPWSMLLPLAAVMAWRRRLVHRSLDEGGLVHRSLGEGGTRVETLLWCWIGAIVVFFSFSAGKQDLYIFPIVPAVAALGGIAIQRGLAQPRWHGWLTRTLAVTGFLLAVAGGAVVWLFDTAGRVYALDGALAVGAVALAGGLVTLVLGLSNRAAASAMTLLAAVITVNWTAVVRVLPEFERYKPVPGFSETLRQRLEPDDVVAHYQVALPSMVFYLQRHVDQYFDEAPFIEAMRSGKRIYAVLSADDFASLASRLPRTCVLDHRPTFEVKLRQVLKRQPLPELLLISNRCP
jgi:4-amino-4-deoxy-L-arabinose transferase-like glycosyltransferase